MGLNTGTALPIEDESLFTIYAHPHIKEGLPGVLGNKGTLAKYRREQGNISQFLGTGEQNSKKLQYENIRIMCGNMGT